MKLKIVATLLVCVSLTSWAAPHAVVNRYVDDFMIRLKMKTSLTEQQTMLLSNILYDGINEREDVIAEYEGETGLFAMKNMRGDLMDVNKVMTGKASEILNEKQMQAFKEIQQENAVKLKKRLEAEKQRFDDENQ